MKGFKVGSQWWWKRADGNRTQVTVTKSLKDKIKLRANISGWSWETADFERLERCTEGDDEQS